MVNTTSQLYDQFGDAYKIWAPRFNMEYAGMWSSNGDSDTFINNITTFVKQGMDALVLDPDQSILGRVSEIMNELKVPWMSAMDTPRDNTKESKPLIHPCITLDAYQGGIMMTDKLYEYATTAWKGVNMKDIGVVSIDYSLVTELHQRTTACQAEWKKLTGSNDNVLVVDCATAQLTMDTANNLVNSMISTNINKYKYWLVQGCFDDLALGAASAIDTLGLTDKSCIVSMGGSALVNQWDAGQKSAWRFALYSPQLIGTEQSLGALYAFLTNKATPDTIWPSWINAKDHGENGHTYPSVQISMYWLAQDTYKRFLTWTDIYAGAKYYNYNISDVKRTDFKAFADIPASYAG